MSTKRFCDRCGREIENGDDYSSIDVDDWQVDEVKRRSVLLDHDDEQLCMGCRVDFERWMRDGKGEAE